MNFPKTQLGFQLSYYPRVEGSLALGILFDPPIVLENLRGSKESQYGSHSWWNAALKSQRTSLGLGYLGLKAREEGVELQGCTRYFEQHSEGSTAQTVDAREHIFIWEGTYDILVYLNAKKFSKFLMELIQCAPFFWAKIAVKSEPAMLEKSKRAHFTHNFKMSTIIHP